MKYLTFTVGNSPTNYCINLDNISSIVNVKDLTIRPIKMGDGFNAIANHMGIVIKVLDSEKAFDQPQLEPTHTLLLINTAEHNQIFVPISKLGSIIDTQNLKRINSRSDQFNFVITFNDTLYLLVEDFFYFGGANKYKDLFLIR